MNKIFFMLIAASGALSAAAQTKAPATTTPVQPARDTMHRVVNHSDSILSRWVIDLNFKGGGFQQDYTVMDPSGNYPNVLGNARYGNMKFTNGSSFGGDIQLGYFFDKAAHFGIGLGFMYLAQQGDVTLDQFHAEYQSVDNKGNAFRQVVTANQPIKEQMKITNMNIPIVLKYKNRFSKHWGFTGDVGLLYNVRTTSSYTTNASFDYEAIYQLQTAAGGQQIAVYDASLTPAANDLIITKAQYMATHPDASSAQVQAYFDQQHNVNGYNVGLGVTPNTKKGDISYTAGSVGFIIQPAINYFFSDKLALNVGLYYTYQSLNHTTSTRRLTDQMGQYSPLLNNVSNAVTQSYGGNLGLRYFFATPKDRDHDGVPDKKDMCPDVWGLPQFNGCPDRDGDGVPDSQDSCVDVPGSVRFHGCPDTDGDGIPDKDDACPYQPGSPATHGCPDSDFDGIPDNLDKCPYQPGPASNNGCPVVDTPKPAPAPAQPTGNQKDRDLAEPILFELGRAKVKDESIPVLIEAVMEMNSSNNAFVIIDGHTDNTGSANTNQALSFKRANAVKKYLTEMGADPKHMISVGHGSRQPIAPNESAEGRAHNRRVIMSVKHHN